MTNIIASILVILIGSTAGVFGGFMMHEQPTPTVQTQAVGGGDSTVNTLPQVKATTTPFLAITSNVHGRDLYFPFSRATTSALAVRSLNASNCDLKADTSGNFYCGTDASGSGGGSGSISTSSPGVVSSLAYFTTAGATPELVSPVATTTLTASSPLSLSNPVAKVGGSNSVLTLDTSGTWTGNAGTASALAANGSNCSSGFYPLGVSAAGAAENCTYAFATTTPWSVGLLAVSSSGAGYTIASSTLFGYTPLNPTRQITIAGTANQITSSAGAQDLSADRTWTLSIPTDFRVSSTTISGNLLAGNATTSSLGVLNLTAASCDVKSTTSGSLFCGTDATAAGSADPFTFVSYFGQTMAATSSGLRLTGSPISIAASGTAQFSNSTTSLATIGTAWLTNLFIGVDTIAEYIADTAGAMFTGNTETDITVTYDDTDNTVDFVVDTLPNLTGTLDIDSGGTGTTTTAAGYAAYWGSSALLGTPTTTASCGTGASCTSFTIFGSSPISISTTLGTAIDSSEITDDTIAVADIADGDWGDFTITTNVAAIDANSVALTTDTTGDYTAGISSSGSITVGNGTGEGASATVNLNMANANIWTALQTFGNSTTSLASFNYASSTVWRGGGLTADCDTAATSKLLWDATTGQFSCGTDQTGAGGGSWPFTPTTNFGTSTQATTTPLWMQGSQFSFFASSTAVLTNASTSQITVSNMLYPATDDGAALGNANFKWSDAFWASGSVLNWNNGDVLLTHSANTLTLSGGSLTFSGNDPDVTTGTNEHFNISPNGTGRVGISSTTPMSLLGVAGTTTTQTLNIDMPTHSGTSTQYIYSNTAAFGGEVILEDMDGAGCTSITTLNGVIYGNVVTCPTAPVAN